MMKTLVQVRAAKTALLVPLTLASACIFDPSRGAGVEQGVSDPDAPLAARGAGGGPGDDDGTEDLVATAVGAGGMGMGGHGGSGGGSGGGDGSTGGATSSSSSSSGSGSAGGGITQLVALTPLSQSALPGASVASPPALRLQDGLGQAMPSTAVTIDLSDGGSFSLGGPALTTTTVITDANGEVHLSGWTLDKLAGPQDLTVDVPGAPHIGRLTYEANGASSFDVRIEPIGSMTASQQAAFTRAKRRWEGVIVNALPPLSSSLDALAQGCGIGSGVAAQAITTEGVVIFAEITPIDGPGAILGSAGPCLVRSGDRSPVAGVMRFDSADVAALEAEGSFEAVILHEMGHVLGVGTLWGLEGFLVNPSLPSSPGADTHHDGPLARAAFHAVGGSIFTAGSEVPVENSAIPGSGDGHWRESVATNELMTPYLDRNGATAPLSRLTVGSIDDFPYYVANYHAADAFTLAPQLQAPGPVTPAPTKACAVLRPHGAFAPAGTQPAFP